MKQLPFLTLAPVTLMVLSGCSEAPTAIADQAPRPVQVIELGNNQQIRLKTFSGVLEAADSANLAFKVPGTIEQILVKTGDTVSKGQIIARLDPHDYQVTVTELEARLEEAKAARALAEIELKRVKQATGDNAIAAVNLDRAVSGYKRSDAMVKVVQQNLQKAKDALSYTQLTAPFNGVIGKQFREQYEQASPGIPVFTLHQPNQLQATIDMPESLVTQFGQIKDAQISWFDADKSLPVQLKEISTLPDPIKQTYTFTYKLERPSSDLLPGKAIQLNLPYQHREDSYCVPYSALKEAEYGPSVFVLKSGKADLQRVEIESIHANQACISGNLKPGDMLITAGAHYLKPGQPVGAIRTVAMNNAMTQ